MEYISIHKYACDIVGHRFKMFVRKPQKIKFPTFLNTELSKLHSIIWGLLNKKVTTDHKQM